LFSNSLKDQAREDVGRKKKIKVVNTEDIQSLNIKALELVLRGVGGGECWCSTEFLLRIRKKT